LPLPSVGSTPLVVFEPFGIAPGGVLLPPYAGHDTLLLLQFIRPIERMIITIEKKTHFFIYYTIVFLFGRKISNQAVS
jgi:hypothetical protein